MSALNFKLPCLAGLLMVAGGCVTTQLSPQQRRSMQVKTFENVSYDNVFRAFKTVLQDEGYIIKNQDMQGGLIVARSSKPMGSGSAILAALSGAKMYTTGTTFEVSINLESIRANHTESRMIIQQTSSYNTGGSQGREIIQPELYQNLYSKVQVEVQRRKAQGK